MNKDFHYFIHMLKRGARMMELQIREFTHGLTESELLELEQVNSELIKIQQNLPEPVTTKRNEIHAHKTEPKKFTQKEIGHTRELIQAMRELVDRAFANEFDDLDDACLQKIKDEYGKKFAKHRGDLIKCWSYGTQKKGSKLRRIVESLAESGADDYYKKTIIGIQKYSSSIGISAGRTLAYEVRNELERLEKLKK